MELYIFQLAKGVGGASLLTRAHFRRLYKYQYMLDHDTNGHCHRVGQLMRCFARQLGFPEQDCLVAYILGYVHDCGKYHVPDAILRKGGPLNAAEFDVVKLHPLLGAEIVFSTTGSRELADVIAAHHERLDGSGYPYGFGERQIMPLSRMLSICDSFEAMTAQRPYRAPLKAQVAAAELERWSDVQFDAMLVELFVRRVLPVWEHDGLLKAVND